MAEYRAELTFEEHQFVARCRDPEAMGRGATRGQAEIKLREALAETTGTPPAEIEIAMVERSALAPDPGRFPTAVTWIVVGVALFLSAFALWDARQPEPPPRPVVSGDFPVGTVLSSLLDPRAFARLVGDPAPVSVSEAHGLTNPPGSKWALANGQPVAGTAYAAALGETLPTLCPPAGVLQQPGAVAIYWYVRID